MRINDFANPVFSREIAEVRASVVPIAEAMELRPDVLIDAARAELGLDDFGPCNSWRERLDVLCAALRDEANLAPFGKLSNVALLTGLLKNRLLLADLLARHPEIHDLEIAAPIIVCGLPRTGTTHLHNLMSADSSLRSLPYWESLEPFAAPGEAATCVEGGPDEDPRITRAKVGCDFLGATMPLFERMHEMTWDHVHEEIQLLAIDLSTMLFETIATVPSWRDYYLAHDQRPHYEYLKTVLKALTFLRPGPGGPTATRWVLKSPQHLEQFPALRATFPDATFVVTHRDPVSVTVSMATMLAYTARMNVAHPDPLATGAEWSARLETMLRTCADQHDVLPPDQTIDVRFDEFMADDIAMVRRIYELARQPFTETTLAEMKGFMDEHPRGKHGTIVYDLADFGLDPAERYEALGFYLDRFALTRER